VSLPEGFRKLPSPCPPAFGTLAAQSATAEALTEQLHRRGFVLFKGLQGISPQGLVKFMQERFPQLILSDIYVGNKNQVEDTKLGSLGNTKDKNGKVQDDFVLAGADGAPLIGATPEQCEVSLDSWLQDNKEAAIMEWHQDNLFTAAPASYNALYCVQSGGSATAYADAAAALDELPDDLKAQVHDAVVKYRASISFGNPSIGISALPKRLIQQSMSTGVDPDAALAKAQSIIGVERRIAAANAAAEQKGKLDWTVFHKLVQPHPHTGILALRLEPRTAETVDDLSLSESQAFIWKVLRHAAQPSNAFLHLWQPGDLLIWDQRRVFHGRVPYPINDQDPRLMWRFDFERDPADSINYLSQNDEQRGNR
jgi:alpha-ketoglutarate-dependent taurine dioxygenase